MTVIIEIFGGKVVSVKSTDPVQFLVVNGDEIVRGNGLNNSFDIFDQDGIYEVHDLKNEIRKKIENYINMEGQ